jgi:hypothetical protein
MANQELSKEDRIFIRTIFKEMRSKTQQYMNDRNFPLSNAQLFTFLSNAPAALAIAGDGNVDESEIAALEILAKAIDVNASVGLELQEMMAVAGEPEDSMINEEFNMRIGSELLYLSRNIDTYEQVITEAVKALLTFDTNPKKDGSLTSALNKLMDSVIENNFSKNKEAEALKMKQIKQQLGI